MKLTPGQVREVIGLTQDAFRHWKTALPPLSGRNGYRPCFTTGDLLAMALIKALTDDGGVRIGALHTVSVNLFDQCGRQSWAGFERMTLVLELARGRTDFVPETQVPQCDGISIAVPCRPILADLRERLLQDEEKSDQGQLRFAPTMVRGGAA